MRTRSGSVAKNEIDGLFGMFLDVCSGKEKSTIQEMVLRKAFPGTIGRSGCW